MATFKSQIIQEISYCKEIMTGKMLTKEEFNEFAEWPVEKLVLMHLVLLQHIIKIPNYASFNNN